MEMPQPNSEILSKKAKIAAALRAVLPYDAVIDDPSETRAYECDALTAYRCPPMINLRSRCCFGRSGLGIRLPIPVMN